MHLRDHPAAMALEMMLQNSPERARLWLLQIPRDQRGSLNIALEDLSMMLSRLGNDV